MILVTVGMQLPFDRLVRAMDRLAARLGVEVYAQIGKTGFRPSHMQYAAVLDAREFEEKVHQATVVVSHAGVGSILAAQRNATPLVILPRKAALGEHRTDHQLDTISHLKGRRGIIPVSDESEIAAAIEEAQLVDRSKIKPAEASPGLKMALKQIIDLEPQPALPRRLFGFFSR